MADDSTAAGRSAPALPAPYQALADHLSELALLVDAQGTMVASLGPSPGPLGYDSSDRPGVHVAERVHPDDLPGVLQLLDRARRTPGLEEHIVVRARHRDGSWRQLEVTSVSRVRDPGIEAGVIRVRDVTALDELPATAAAEHTRFVSLAEALPIGVLSADAHGFLVFANEIATAALGVEFGQLRGDRWLDCVHERDRALVLATVKDVRTSRASARITVRTAAHTPAADADRWLELYFVPLVEADRYVGWVATLEDVTTRLANERTLAHRATHDSLTGLPNRWLLMDRLRLSLAQVERRGGGIAVVFVDLDGLKAHNDAHGHAAGDAVLVDVARRLEGSLDASETAARIGGDEFVVIGEAPDGAAAAAMASRIHSLLSYRLRYGGVDLPVAASVGVAYARSDHDGALPPEAASAGELVASPEALVVRADAAMYESRRARRVR